MKKLLSVVLLIVLVVSLATTVKAATLSSESEALYNYISKDFKVAGKDVKLLNDYYLSTAQSYLAAHPIDKDTRALVESNLDEVLAIMDQQGVTNIFALKGNSQVEGLIKEAATALDLKVNYDPTTGNVVVKTANDTPLVTVSAKTAVANPSSSTSVVVPVTTPSLVQTDVVDYSYLVVPAVAIIAVAMFVVYKKLAKNA